MIREAIDAVVRRQDLSLEDSAQAMNEIMMGEATPAQISAFITGLRMKGETVDEITGMARTMRGQSLHVETAGDLVDTCGTGGDGRGTINVSTAAAIVTAATGVKVAKHGNRAASGQCGSADVLEAMGVKIDLAPDGVKQCIDEEGFGFMFAQTFHPSMRHAGGPRREIGIRTVFNILGPLTNPAGAQGQVLGVADETIGEKMAEVLGSLGTRRAMVVYGMDGLDEISIGAPTQVWELAEGKVSSYIIAPEDAGLNRASVDEILGGTVETNADRLTRVLSGEIGPALDVVLLNAAAALMVGGTVSTFREGVDQARKAVVEGRAAAKLAAIVGLSQRLA